MVVADCASGGTALWGIGYRLAHSALGINVGLQRRARVLTGEQGDGAMALGAIGGYTITRCLGALVRRTSAMLEAEVQVAGDTDKRQKVELVASLDGAVGADAQVHVAGRVGRTGTKM